MHEHDLGDLADRVVLTPAERAVLVEQSEEMKVNLDKFIANCKDAASGVTIRSYVDVHRCGEYVNGIINQKILAVVAKMQEE